MKNPEFHLDVVIQAEDSEWDTFVSKCPDGHHVQTSLWGQVKAAIGWRAIRAILYEDQRIIAGCQLLIRNLKFIGNVGYITKGPLFIDYSSRLVKEFLSEIINISRDYSLKYLVIQPPNNGMLIGNELLSMGFRPSWLDVAPTATILINLSMDTKDIIGQMKRQNRQNIRRSEKEGIIVREGDLDDIHTFYMLHKLTSQRQKFIPYAEEYFIKMWQELNRHGYIKLFISEYKKEPISALLVVPFGDTVIPKILGWSGQYGKKRPNEAVFWGSIKWAKEAGFKYYDMEGINPDGARAVSEGKPLPISLKDSPTRFKLGFGGNIVFYPQPYDYVFNPLLRFGYSQLSNRISNWPAIYRKVLDMNRME